MKTIKCKLVGVKKCINSMEELVFQISPIDFLFVVKFRNWIHEPINYNEEGFLTYKEIKPGDTYFDGINYKTYNYEIRQFINFIKPNVQDEFIKINL